MSVANAVPRGATMHICMQVLIPPRGAHAHPHPAPHGLRNVSNLVCRMRSRVRLDDAQLRSAKGFPDLISAYASSAWLADGGQAKRNTYPTNPLVRDYAYACMSIFACILSMSLHVACILVCLHCMPHLHGWLTHAPRAHPAWLADGGQAYRDTYPTNPLVRDYAYACMSGFACVLSMSLHVVCILVCWHCMPPPAWVVKCCLKAAVAIAVCGGFARIMSPPLPMPTPSTPHMVCGWWPSPGIPIALKHACQSSLAYHPCPCMPQTSLCVLALHAALASECDIASPDHQDMPKLAGRRILYTGSARRVSRANLV
jgi:hypothetical protein